MEQKNALPWEQEERTLRDYLALKRTWLANQRTLLSFLRTGLYLMVTAVAVLKLEPFENLKFLAWILMTAAILVWAIGVVSFLRMKKRLNRYYPTKQ